MTQGIPHGQEIEALVPEWQVLHHPLHQGDREGPPRFAQHAAARVEPDHVAGFTEDAHGRTGHEAGAGRDVEKLHAATEAVLSQHVVAIELAGAERADSADPVVVSRGTVEQRGDEGLFLPLVRVVLLEDRMRRRGCAHGTVPVRLRPRRARWSARS